MTVQEHTAEVQAPLSMCEEWEGSWFSNETKMKKKKDKTNKRKTTVTRGLRGGSYSDN